MLREGKIYWREGNYAVEPQRGIPKRMKRNGKITRKGENEIVKEIQNIMEDTR